MSTSTKLSLPIAAALLAACAAFAHAQGIRPAPSIPPAAKTGASAKPDTVVHLDVDVDTKAGEPIPGLTQSDFTLLDNNSAPSGVKFKAVAPGQGQQEVIILMDAVNSPFQTVAYEQQQLEKFLKTKGATLPHPTTVAYVTDTGAQIQKGFTTNGVELEASLEKIATGLRFLTRNAGYWGDTEQYTMSISALQQVAGYCAQLPGRKLVIWVSPGWPLLSGVRTELDGKQEADVFRDIVAFSTALRVAHVTLDNVNPRGVNESILRDYYYQEFTKGVSKLSDVYLGDLSLQVLATQSGGTVVESDNDIAQSVARLMNATTSWYEFDYPMPVTEQANQYHHVEVKVDKPGAKVTTRDGYYDQPSK
uniref:VWFA-related domain-containing protein n=1 Tax=mine drainage metagenome TaxID=410659 RepID=E6QHL4_9ZZZZ